VHQGAHSDAGRVAAWSDGLRTLRALGREHLGIVVVVALAGALRLAAALAYRPALLSKDSWGYLDTALRAQPVGFAPERPSGYPLVLRALLLPGDSLALVTTVQHLLGLASGVLVYALLVRLSVPRAVAVAAAALVLFDIYAIGLEQHLLSEPLFEFALLSSAFLAISARSVPGMAISGALLGAAVTLRTAGLFAVPIWLLYLVWSRRGPRAIATAAIPLCLVVVGYAALHARGDPTRDANPGNLSLTEMDGWFLYAKTAAIADCDGADIPQRAGPLCQAPAERSRDADFYLFNRASPAKQLVGHHRSGARQISDNRMLRDFALAIIREQPQEYARIVADDVATIFTPGGRGVDVTIRLPRPGARLAGGGRAPLACRDCDAVDNEPVDHPIRDEYQPGYEPRVRWPAQFLVALQDWSHTPRWLMGLFALVTVLAAALSLTPLRNRLEHRREIVLLGGIALAVVVGSAAVANPVVRFLVPVVPLLTAAAAVAACDLASLRAYKRSA
jgi:hypothetical protein